ncbi:uncharacterized protein BJX67DRAFT_373656 [Aspergillus lucknowensis]|uniref:Histidine phosphatase superfamily n=1 Tax=Aspergillus lucknowensis TaxID=176173 RepID=A0ABR4LJD7_9EURO
MSNLSDLETSTSDLTAALKTLITHCQSHPANGTQLLVLPDAPSEVHRSRQSSLVAISRLQTLLADPADFLHHLAIQNQLLACLQWLGEFQVLACIPLQGTVPIKDVADLAGVSETHLSRVVRMTATAGFLKEPQTGQVAHSALSAPFVTKPSYLDAVMFLAGTVAPAALQMPTATQRFGSSLRANETAYNLAFNTPNTFSSLCEQRPKLQRQWPAFLRYGTNEADDRVTDLLSRLDQLRLGNITVVEVGARSIDRATLLATHHPTLHFIVQIATTTTTTPCPATWPPPPPSSKLNDLRQLTTSNSPNNANGTTTTTTTTKTSIPSTTTPNITIQQRTPTTPQPVPDAALYILHLPSPSPTTPFSSLAARIIAELRAHLDVLRSNPTATLILTPRLLPDPAAVTPEVEVTARLRDLSLLQLSNEREIDLAEWMSLLNSVSDSMGRLPIMAACLSLALLSLFLSTSPAAAQDHTAQVWATFAYTVHGESIPQVFPGPRTLTSHGANQLHDAGAAFRDRYLRIANLSPYLLDNEDIKVASTPELADLASAQAFMQGLYPPLDQAFNDTSFEYESRLADGSAATAPLGGYQYPPIITFGYEDPQSLILSGQAFCPTHAFANAEYIGSKEFWETYEESAAFYNRLQTNYANSASISEYLNYQVVHNETLMHSLSPEDIKRARWYAGKYMFATNGNRSAANSGGLASRRGADSKMTLQFGLARTEDSNFTSLPNPGASIVLELFSMESESSTAYPDPAKLYVRPYPLFGYSPSKMAVPIREFQDEMQKISLESVIDWCRRCNSSAVFCSGVLDTGRSSGNTNRGGVSAPVAGVIGAVVTIVVLALMAIFGFLAYSWRTKRLRKPSLGGFKGDRKLASDSDLTFKDPHWGNNTVQPPQASARAHERHGSWEMASHKKPNAGSSFADEVEEEWQLHSAVKAIGVREQV